MPLEVKKPADKAVISLEEDMGFPTLFVEKNGRKVELLYIDGDGIICRNDITASEQALLNGDISFVGNVIDVDG